MTRYLNSLLNLLSLLLPSHLVLQPKIGSAGVPPNHLHCRRGLLRQQLSNEHDKLEASIEKSLPLCGAVLTNSFVIQVG